MKMNDIKFLPKANAFSDVYSKATGVPFIGEMMAAAAGNGGKDEYITYTLEDAFGSCDDESRCYDGKTITFNRPEGWEDTFFVAYKIMEKYYYDEDTRKVEARTFEDMEEMEWINSEDSPMYDLFPYVQEEQDIPDETENEWLVMAQITDDNVTITDKWTINVDNRTEYPYCSQCPTPTFELTVKVVKRGEDVFDIDVTSNMPAPVENASIFITDNPWMVGCEGDYSNAFEGHFVPSSEDPTVWYSDDYWVTQGEVEDGCGFAFIATADWLEGSVTDPSDGTVYEHSITGTWTFEDQTPNEER